MPLGYQLNIKKEVEKTMADWHLQKCYWRCRLHTFAATWMNLEIIILSEVREGKIPYDIIYMWKLKYGNNELIYKTEQVHRHRKQTYGYQTGKRVKEG